MEPQSQPGTVHDAPEEHCFDHQHIKCCCSNSKESSDELIILRALYLSHKRAEEAERNMLVANQEKEEIAKLIIEVSEKVNGYKNWARVIEMDSAQLMKGMEATRMKMRSGGEKRVDVRTNCWELGLLFLGFAGAGFILGRNM